MSELVQHHAAVAKASSDAVDVLTSIRQRANATVEAVQASAGNAWAGSWQRAGGNSMDNITQKLVAFHQAANQLQEQLQTGNNKLTSAGDDAARPLTNLV